MPTSVEARATVKRYFNALAGGEAAAMCRELSQQACEDAASFAHAGSCMDAARMVVQTTQPELLHDLALARIGRAQVHGNRATVQVTGDDTYASERRTVAVPLEARDGRWMIEKLPTPDNKADPVTMCIIGGLESFDRGEVAGLWKREGRADFVVYMRQFCKRAEAADLIDEHATKVSAEDRKALKRVAVDVIDEMVRSGRIERS